MTAIYVVLALIVAVVLWAIAIYNRLVKNKNMVKEGWSGIDVQLKRRANLVPNLIETVKGYMGHERDVLKAAGQSQDSYHPHWYSGRSFGSAGISGLGESLGGALSSAVASASSAPGSSGGGSSGGGGGGGGGDGW